MRGQFPAELQPFHFESYVCGSGYPRVFPPADLQQALEIMRMFTAQSTHQLFVKRSLEFVAAHIAPCIPEASCKFPC